MRLLFALTPILCAAAIPAADDIDAILRGDEQLPFVEVRFGVGKTPIPDYYPVKAVMFDSGYTFPVEDYVDTDKANSFTYGIVGADLHPFGLVGGAEMVYSQASQHVTQHTEDGVDVPVPEGGSSLRYSTFGGNGLLGVGLALGPRAHLEALGVLGVGGLDLDFSDGTAEGQNHGSGWYWNYGLRGGAYYRFGRLVLGAVVEYSHIKIDASKDWANASTSTSTDASGIGYRLEIGYHIQ